MSNDKNMIIKMYFDDKMTPLEVAGKVNKSKQYICMVLREDSRYENEKAVRAKEKNDKKENMSAEINSYYYDDGLKPSDIAQMMDVSPAYVTKVIKGNTLYVAEKDKRKNDSLQHRREASRETMRAKRGSSHNDDAVIKDLLLLQAQNAISMSRSRKISDDGIVEMNINHYSYNSSKGKLEYNDNCGKRPWDLPKSKKVHEPITYPGKSYEESFENSICL